MNYLKIQLYADVIYNSATAQKYYILGGEKTTLLHMRILISIVLVVKYSLHTVKSFAWCLCVSHFLRIANSITKSF